MKATIICIIGLLWSWGQAGSDPLVEGRVRLDSGEPAAGAQVLLFDLTNLRAAPVRATTDEMGYFALPFGALPGTALPERFELGQNHPNPFNPSTIIPYQLPLAARVRLEIFNILGQHVATLVDGEKAAGFHTARWDATDRAGRAVAAGVYLYRLKNGGVHLTRRMLLIDGQAGIPAAGPGGPPAAGGEAVKTAPAYGLTVSGAGLVPFVDPAFRVETGMPPVDLLVETFDGIPRAKAATAGILGDVDNNGRVDIFDALLVAVYSANAGLVMPNNGDIALGDVNRDGRTDLTDAYHIATYTVNSSDPALPAGIGSASTQQPGQTPAAGSAASKLYWTDWGTDKIQRANLDGSNVEDLVTTGLAGPDGLAVDAGGGKMYWTDLHLSKIQRANLDGSNVEDLITSGLGLPYGLALDVSGGKMYWTDRQSSKIQRANLDGSNLQDLVTSGLAFPGGLALDVSGGKIYWTNPGVNKIQRANLDGSNLQDLVTSGLNSPNGLALDVAGGKIYWTDRGTDKIQRANLDGSNLQDLVTSGLNSPNGLALDVAAGKIYWADAGTNKIQRANLDGSGIEDLLTSADGLVDPSGLALGVGADSQSVSGPAQVTVALSPLPSTVSFLDDGAWHRFTVQASVPIVMVANPTGTTPRVEINNLSSSNYCPAEANDDLTRRDGEDVVLAGCSSGTGTVELRRASDQTVLQTYTFTIQRQGTGGGGTAAAPDLVVQAPTVSNSSPTAGASFTLRATVRNQGAARSASTTLRYYRSNDATISTSDTEVGTDGVFGLSAARTSAEWISLRAPSSAGTYYYGACVVSVSGESNTGNNCSAAVTVTVGTAAAPDLVVDAPTVSNSSPTAGASFTLRATVRNQGTGRSASTTLRYYRSTDATISTSDTEAGTDGVFGLSASRTSAEWISLRAPSSAGTYYYGACVVSVSGESNTGNNCSAAVTVTVGAAAAPDLVVQAPTVSNSSPTAGASFTLRATVRNQGTGRSASTTLRYYRSTDATVSTSDTEVGTDGVFGLSASSTSAESIFLSAPSSAGTYYYGACVESVSGESNTGNNCSAAVTVTVGAAAAPDLVVQAPTVSNSSPTAGASFTLSATVRNQGTGRSASSTLRYYRSTDVTISTSDTQIGTDGVFGLSASSTSAEWISLTAPSSAGTYYYGACVVSVSGESDTQNNCSAAVTVSVGAAPAPDLVVQAPSVNPSSPTAGASFTLRATVRNQGTGQSAATTLRYYRSTNVTISTSDTEVGTDAVGGLSAAGTSDESISLTAPSSAGTYYYGACVVSVSGESDTQNNCSAAVTVSVGAAPAPDLVVDAPTVSPSSPTAGASFTLRATVRNQGSGRSASTTLRYYRSTDVSISTSDTQVGTDAVGGLSASRTSAEWISLTAPSNAGTYYYGACAVSVSDETDTGNNCSSAVTVTVGAAPAPDLVVQAPSVNPSSPTAGASFTLSATVRNQGTGQSASTTLRYYRSNDATISTSDTQVGTDAVGGLSAAGTSAESISLTAPSNAGTYYYGACVVSVSGESNTQNNCSAAVIVTVGAAPAPDLVVQAPTVNPSSPTAGASFTLSATVRNQGTGQSASTTLRYYRSNDATISTSDTQVGTDAVGGLSAAGTSAESISLTAPSNAGTYYYGACVVSVSGESDTQNNCSAAVTVSVGAAPAPDLVVQAPSVNPSSPTAGASFTLSATVRNQGTGQSAATTLRYYRSTDATVSTSDTEVGTDGVSGLASAGTSDESISLTAPSTPDTYYYGACVESVSGESNTQNNCSSAVTVTVSATVTQPEPQPAGVSKMYWSDWGTDKIQRADLDGSNIEDLVTSGLDGPDGLSVDAAAGKLYWTDAGTAKIQRADLDGSNVEDLITSGLSIPYGLALDVSGGKIYWTDRQSSKIQRADLDGSNVEDLLTLAGLAFPAEIAVDAAGGKIYWANPGADKIQRASLDGSNLEDVVTSGLSSPNGLALDVAGGKIYWTDRGTDKIQRADLDGSNVQDLVTSGLSGPNGLDLDAAGGKIYWTDAETDKLQRANLDGSGVEDLITSSDGLVDPSGLALGRGSGQ